MQSQRGCVNWKRNCGYCGASDRRLTYWLRPRLQPLGKRHLHRGDREQPRGLARLGGTTTSRGNHKGCPYT